MFDKKENNREEEYFIDSTEEKLVYTQDTWNFSWTQKELSSALKLSRQLTLQFSIHKRALNQKLFHSEPIPPTELLKKGFSYLSRMWHLLFLNI